MRHSMLRAPLSLVRFLLPMLPCALLSPFVVHCQDSGAEGTVLRGDKAEISVTVRDSSGEPISSPANVKINRGGMQIDQQPTAHGRAFFIVRTLGDFTVTVEANGYQMIQKDISVPVAVRAEVEVVMRRESASGDTSGVPGRPLLAPKAKEAYEKGLQALSEDKLDEAEKYVGEAMKLAPGHPDVLYVQGVLYLRRRNWTQAQSTLEKATEIDPNHARAFAALGMAFSNQGKYDAAIPPLEKSLQMEAGAWETHWALAKAYYHHRQFEEALKSSQQALSDSKGKAPEIELLVAQSLTAVGRYEDSAQELREFLKSHSDRPEAATARRYLERLAADGKIRRN